LGTNLDGLRAHLQEGVAQEGWGWRDGVHGAAADKPLQRQIESTDEEIAIVQGREH